MTRHPGDSFRETGSEIVSMMWQDGPAGEPGWVIKCSCGWQTFTKENAAARWFTEIHGQSHWGRWAGTP